MPTIFCSHCGAKATYEAVKPAACAKCGTAILDPLAMMAKAVAASTVTPAAPPAYRPTVIVGGPRPAPVYSDPQEAPLQPVHSDRSRPAHRAHADDRRSPRQLDPLYPDEQPGERSLNEDHYDRGEARRLARELVASIDPDSIQVGPELDEDDRVTFGSLFPREQAAPAPKRKKGKR